MFILTRALFANNEILSAVSTEFERKEYLAKTNYYLNTWRGATRGAGSPETRGHQRRGAQCNRIGCIGLRPVLSPLCKHVFGNLPIGMWFTRRILRQAHCCTSVFESLNGPWAKNRVNKITIRFDYLMVEVICTQIQLLWKLWTKKNELINIIPIFCFHSGKNHSFSYFSFQGRFNFKTNTRAAYENIA